MQNPQPSLALSASPGNPTNHNWTVYNDSHDTMARITLTAGAGQAVSMNSLSLMAHGTGNDMADVRVVYLIGDQDNDGVYDAGDTILGYGMYTRDNGTIVFDVPNGYQINAAASATLLVAYDMKGGSAGSTYSFDIEAVSATGMATQEAAAVSGLPFASGVKTLVDYPQTTTTTTTIPSSDECQTDADCPQESCSNLAESTYACKLSPVTSLHICAATIESVQCCGSGDCGEGETCLLHACIPIEPELPWLGGRVNYVLLGETIAAVVGGALVLFLFMKNRRQTPWKGKREYESDWGKLRKKWKR